jgi:hypothetical protein
MASGNLRKMTVSKEETIRYDLVLDEKIRVNSLVGKVISLNWSGVITCTACQKNTKKSFGDGFCYTCFISAPEAAECTIRPELCRAHLGEGRDPEWEERNHNTPHIVYLAATDIVKVGVTRITQVPTRWIDQGASSAIRLAETPNRYEAGRLEVALKDFFADKTNWQRMLKNEIDESIDLVEEKWTLHDQLPADLTQFFTENDEVIALNYPVLEFPEKVKSLSFEKTAHISGKLMGVKGQYLLFEGGEVLNIRKHTGYFVTLDILN